MSRQPLRQAGFTIVELLIATTVFSLILVVITVGVMQFTKSYYRGVTATSTQNVARTTIDDISQTIQLSGLKVSRMTEDSPRASVQPNARLRSKGYCVGSIRYSYLPGWQLKAARNVTAYQNTYVLVRDAPSGGCAGNSAQVPQDLLGGAPVRGTELLTPNMRVSKFVLEPAGGDPNLFLATLRIVYGDADLLTSAKLPTGSDALRATADDATCRNATAGTQFCAVSELSTMVRRRVN